MTTRRPELLGASGPSRDADAVLEAARRHVPEAAVVDATRIGGRAHLRAAVDHAVAAIDDDRARARDPSMEVLLHAAGTDQIEDALDRVGLAGQVEAVAVAFLGDVDVDAFLDELDWSADEAVLEPADARVRTVASERGWPGEGDALDWLIEDAALVALS